MEGDRRSSNSVLVITAGTDLRCLLKGTIFVEHCLKNRQRVDADQGLSFLFGKLIKMQASKIKPAPLA